MSLRGAHVFNGRRGTNFARSKIERTKYGPQGKLHGCNL